MASASSGAAKKQVLVVGEDPDILETVGEVLQVEGYPVHMASSGPDGMTWLRANAAPGLVLLGLDSAEAVLFLSHLGPLASIPVVVLTADKAPPAFAGAAEVLAMPFELQTLFDTVARYC